MPEMNKHLNNLEFIIDESMEGAKCTLIKLGIYSVGFGLCLAGVFKSVYQFGWFNANKEVAEKFKDAFASKVS